MWLAYLFSQRMGLLWLDEKGLAHSSYLRWYVDLPRLC